MQVHKRVIASAACLAGAFGLAAPVASAADEEAPVHGVYRGVTTAVRFDVSPPLRSIRPLPIRPEVHAELEDRPSGLEGLPGVEDFDALVQSQVGPGEVPAPLIGFDGPNNIAGVSPPDPVGDVGPNHYVAMSNLYFAVYDKAGTLLFGPAANNTLWSGFGGDCQTDNSGDPIVVYDQLADRWILTQFTASGPTFFNCVAVSTTSDPTGSYFRYAVPTGTNFPDYPKYGVWPDALYISTREFAGATFAGVGAYAVNRAQIIAGNPTPQIISFLVTPAGAGGAYNVGDGLLPSDLDGSTLPPAGTPNFFVGSMDSGGPYGAPQDALTLWKFTADFANPPASTFTLTDTIPVAAFDSIFPCSPGSRNCIPQPNTTNKIDILSYRQRPLHRLAYRNFGTHESLVTNQSVEAATNMAGIRWYEVRSPNASPVVFQQGTYAPGAADGIHRWMGSIAMDQAGNMALGYSASNATTTFPSVWYTGRLAGDPPGTMPQGEGSFVDGTGSQTGSARWGDYTSMNVDPVDDCTFWYVNEYVPTTSSIGWRLRIGAFRFPACGNFSLSVSPPSLIIIQETSRTASVSVNSISGFSAPVTLSASGLPAGVTASFAPNPVTPPAGGSAGSTLTLTASPTAATGTFTVTITGASGSLVRTTTLTLIVRANVVAVFDPGLKAPRCSTVGSSCDTGLSLVLSRDTIAGRAELNQPNTINNSCADGIRGTFHVDESNDRLRVVSVNGTVFAPGRTVRVEATVWAWAGSPTSDKLDLFYAANANAPVWTYITTLTPSVAGSQVLSATYVLPSGALQAVRANFRYVGAASPCTTGVFDDRDDLIFAVRNIVPLPEPLPEEQLSPSDATPSPAAPSRTSP